MSPTATDVGRLPRHLIARYLSQRNLGSWHFDPFVHEIVVYYLLSIVILTSNSFSSNKKKSREGKELLKSYFFGLKRNFVQSSSWNLVDSTRGVEQVVETVELPMS
jgi:hypothetical protein